MLPFPSVMPVSISPMRLKPSRHGTHLPHDSSWRNLWSTLQGQTMHVSSSITIIPPDPSLTRLLSIVHNQQGYLRDFQDASPTGASSLHSFKGLAARDPAADVKNNLTQGHAIGTSTSPVLFIFPTKLKNLCSFTDSVPMPEYHSGPLLLLGYVRPGFHIVQVWRHVPQSFFGSVYVFCPRFSWFSFKWLPWGLLIPHIRMLLRLCWLYIKAESWAKNIISKKTEFSACLIAINRFETASGYSFLTYT